MPPLQTKTHPQPIPHFHHPWRDYQQRVLNQLDRHLADGHVHIIAPPGSGKTVLGLEIIRRLDRPALILAPTLAIRRQWGDRFCLLFLDTAQPPDWISTDLRRPAFLTLATYQGLHHLCEEEAETSDFDVVAALKQAGVATLVVDEAHHLKNAWWRSLMQVKTALKPVVVGLTATPPYDVTRAEWSRYLELNGPVDLEISVPELVRAENLCPHQDCVFYAKPTAAEHAQMQAHYERMQAFVETIKSDEALIETLAAHPAIRQPQAQLEWIYTRVEAYVGMLVVLAAAGHEFTESHTKLLGDDSFELPELTDRWIQVVLNLVLTDDSFAQTETNLLFREELANRLKRRRLLEQGQVKLHFNRKIDKLLTSSLSKLQAIEEIAAFEAKQLAETLRLVVLTDFIRPAFLSKSETNELPLNKLGAVPIFEQLRRSGRHSKLALLTGSVVILPVSVLEKLNHSAAKSGLLFSAVPLTFDAMFVRISTTGGVGQSLVGLVTELFEAGEIELLIGTKALLGEGWDAPAINALILASFVGSHVSSNQMRGRAIRTDLNRPGKTANIWHLACLDPYGEDGGRDLRQLRRRFDTFVGLSAEAETGIVSGFERMQPPSQFSEARHLAAANEATFERAANRPKLQTRWNEALQHGTEIVEEVRVPFADEQKKSYSAVKQFHSRRTLAYGAATLALALLGFVVELGETLAWRGFRFDSAEEFGGWLLFACGSAAVLFGGQTWWSFRHYVRYRDLSKDFAALAEVVADAFDREKLFETERNELQVVAKTDLRGTVSCYLKGDTSRDQAQFVVAIAELTAPVDNPRYLLIRKSRFWHIRPQRDYHAIPEALGRRKASAKYFAERWRERVGRCELVFTRTLAGRRLLMQARLKSLAAQLNEGPVRVREWR